MKKHIQVIFRHRLMHSISGLRSILFLLYNELSNQWKLRLEEMKINICYVTVNQLYLWKFHILID